MDITDLNKEEILKLSNKAGAYEFGRQKGYRDGFHNGCRSGAKQTNKKLQHYYDTTVGLWCIDRDPEKVDIDWIRRNAFRLK